MASEMESAPLVASQQPAVAAPRRARAPLVGLLVAVALAGFAAHSSVTRSSASPRLAAADSRAAAAAAPSTATATHMVSNFTVIDHDGANRLKRIAVATLQSSALAGRTAKLAVRYAPEGSALAPLWSAAVEVAAATDGAKELRVELPLHRLRGGANYQAELFVAFADDDAGASAAMSSTASFFTNGPGNNAVEVCDQFHTGTPVADVFSRAGADEKGFTYEVIITGWIEQACNEWEGLVALDAEGYVVWCVRVNMERLLARSLSRS